MKKLMERRIEKKLYLIFWSIIILFGLIFVWNIQRIFPEKYFYDSLRILNKIQVKEYYDGLGDSYGLSAMVFSIFPIKSLKNYNIFIYIIFIPFFYNFLKNSPQNIKICILNLIFFILSIIYLLRPGKEILQLIILFLCYLNKKYIFIILIISGIFFRHYLIIQSFFYLGILLLVKSKYKKLNFIILFFIFIFFNIKYPKLMEMIFNVRNEVNEYRIDSEDAQSIILNIFNKKGIVYMYLNYLLNLIRLLFPIELLKINFKYIPYIIFQMYFSIRLWNWREKIQKEYVILLYSYILVSTIFEPDFGSYLRHTVPYLLFFINLEREEYKIKNEKNSFYNTNFK